MKVTVVQLTQDEPTQPVPVAKPTTATSPPIRPAVRPLSSPTVPVRVSPPVEPSLVRSSDVPPTVVPKVVAAYPKASPRPSSAPLPPSGTKRPAKSPARPSGAPLWTPAVESPPPIPGEANGVPADRDSVVSARPDRFVKLNDVAAVTVLQAASVEARFEVAVDGTAKVSLLKGTGITDIDAKIVEFLSTVRWTPKTVGGVPVADVVIMDLDTEG